MGAEPMRVLIADDEPLARDRLRALLAEQAVATRAPLVAAATGEGAAVVPLVHAHLGA